MKPFSGYRATSTDGVLVIHDVPIFVECSRGEHDFSRDWINAAVAKAMQAEHDGYLPPLHVRHHGKTGMDDPVKAAGFFRIKGTQEISFKGSVRMAVVADLHITDPSVKEDVLAKRLPYRSVEIFDVDKPALDSLALLDHEAPYLELPMLMVSDVSDQDSVSHMQRGVAHATFYNPWLQRHADTFNPVVACFRRGSSAIVLFEDKPIMSKNKQVQFGEKADEESMGGYGPKGRKMSDSSSKKEETKDSEQMQEGAMDCASICEAIKSGTISVADMAAIQQAIAEMTSAQAKPEEGMADEPMEDDEAKMQEDEKDKKDAPPMSTASMSGVPASAVQAMARIAGENAALKARLDARDAADRRRDDVTVAVATSGSGSRTTTRSSARWLSRHTSTAWSMCSARCRSLPTTARPHSQRRLTSFRPPRSSGRRTAPTPSRRPHALRVSGVT